ncbi:hypothetical protein Bbelb_123720 [Branchiostoma belcheri]|nr:hypothetical protein Bbelb_123720 [Branchiostoma belcheri]
MEKIFGTEKKQSTWPGGQLEEVVTLAGIYDTRPFCGGKHGLFWRGWTSKGGSTDKRTIRGISLQNPVRSLSERLFVPANTRPQRPAVTASFRVRGETWGAVNPAVVAARATSEIAHNMSRPQLSKHPHMLWALQQLGRVGAYQ